MKYLIISLVFFYEISGCVMAQPFGVRRFTITDANVVKTVIAVCGLAHLQKELMQPMPQSQQLLATETKALPNKQLHKLLKQSKQKKDHHQPSTLHKQPYR